MRCEEVMQRNVISVGPEDTVQHAARIMRDANIGFLPVCIQSNALGIVTDRDIALRLAAENRAAASTLVMHIMTSRVISCHLKDDLDRAEELMGEHHKSRILCTDDDGHVAGVISLSDIAQRESAQRAGRLVRMVTERETRPGS